ncbi:MAG: hypothetical protein ACRD20_07250 [Terriglobales bacterium]
MKTAAALLLITAIIVAAAWFITRELRSQVSEQERRLKQQETLVAELEKRPHFVPYTVDTILQNARNAQIPIWIADSRIALAWLNFEVLGDTAINKSVMLAPSSKARAPIQLGPPFQTGSATDPACAWKFFLDGNKVVLDLSDTRCNVPLPAHIMIEGAAEVTVPTAESH